QPQLAEQPTSLGREDRHQLDVPVIELALRLGIGTVEQILDPGTLGRYAKIHPVEQIRILEHLQEPPVFALGRFREDPRRIERPMLDHALGRFTAVLSSLDLGSTHDFADFYTQKISKDRLRLG